MANNKTKKSLKLSLIITASILAVVGVVLFVFLVVLKPEEIQTFAFSGYVFADGEPLSGAKVSCGFFETETDENGYYKMDNLTKVVEVTVSKDNFIFGNELVFVNSDKENINFFGYELFSLSGVVKNGNEVVPFAEIKVVSEAGEYITRANAFGIFNLPKLAGEVKLSASHDNIELFSQTFDKTKEELVVTGTTNLTGRIVCDSNIDYDFTLELNGEKVTIDSNLKFNIESVQPNSKLKLYSENYHIKESEMFVSIENGNFEFYAEKYYDVSGKVISGVTPLSNARVIIGKWKTYSNSQGDFSLNSLYGEQVITTSRQGYNFEDKVINNRNTLVEIVGKFDLKGQVFTDDKIFSAIEIKSSEKVCKTNSKGEFLLNDIQLGDIVTVNTSNYFVQENNIEIVSTAGITFNLQKFYDLEVDITYREEPLNSVKAIINKLSYCTDKNGKILIEKLHGSNSIVMSLDGYVFEDNYSIDYMNNTLNITPLKIYNLHGYIVSGENVVPSASIKLKDIVVESDSNGYFEINDIFGEGTLEVVADNYNCKTVHYSIDNNDLDIEIDYDIYGNIICGGFYVENVKVILGDKITYSDYLGSFCFLGVKGNVEISYEKEYYTFENFNISNGENLQIDCSYKIVGKVTNKEGVIEGLDVSILKNSDTTETIICKTDENGNYEFSNLKGEYLLIYDSEYKESLLPNGYTVSSGGVYNFSDSGFKIKGRVMTGDVPVAGVKVTVGDLETTTNAQGYYKFDLIISAGNLVLTKEGYEFTNNNFPVDLSLDGREDIDFDCTYSVSGVVSSGDEVIPNVKVNMGGLETYTDSNGYYSLSGVSGKVNPYLELNSYYFDMPEYITSTGIYNVSAMFDSQVFVKTGNVAVSNVSVNLNGNIFITNSDGLITLKNVQIGDKVIFEKHGFDISDYDFCQYSDSITIDCSFSIEGRVYLTSSILNGVRVECAGMVVITDDNGYFKFNGLIGENEITLSKDNYQFDVIEISEYKELTISAKYTITGTVSVSGVGLEGVIVRAGDAIAYTDSYGDYILTNITDEVTLQLEKFGYEFPGTYIINYPSVVDIIATYRISGTVKSGNMEIVGATIEVSNGLTIYTDNNGYFTLSGVNEVVSIEIFADGYNSVFIEYIDRFVNDLTINLTYSVTIQLTNITNLTDVSIMIDDVLSKHSNSTILFDGLSGEVLINIEKIGYNFSPSQVIVSSNTNLTIIVKKEYAISGKILTTNGLPASGVTISAGGKETITDSNGYYMLSPFVDPVQIKLIMSVLDTSYKGENYDYSVNIDQVSSDAVKDFSVNESEYAYFLFKKGYQNLNDALTYQIFGSGIVSDSKSGASQDVSIVYKKDSKNIRLIQNLNWHNGKIMGMVDPRIAQLTYVDMNNKIVKYQTIKGEDVSKGDANWVTSWSSTNYADYLKDYGVNAEGYYAYNINKSTISNTTSMILNNGLYKFTFELAMTDAMYNYYLIQMSKMCSDQSFVQFYHCNITYTIGQDGYIRTMYIDEKYQVSAMFGVKSDVTDSITYNFKTFTANEMINDIDITTTAKIKASLSEETATILATNNFGLNYDIYLERRRKLV